MPNKRDYNDFNRALDKLMGNSFNEEVSLYENLGMGRLIVQVFTANGAVPLENARVVVMDTSNNEIVELLTDNSGRTSSIELPAPLAKYSLNPNDIKPYSTYNIKVFYPNYYTEEFLNVPVFDKIESIQPVSMQPLLENATEEDKIREKKIDESVQGPFRQENQALSIEEGM